MEPTTVGTLLNGRVRYEQAAAGYRTGIEPVFLAAAVPARSGERVLEGGTGAGAGLLCLLFRVAGVTALGVERDPATAEIARRNAAGVPGLSIHTGAIERLDGVEPFDHVCANPPWHDPAGTLPNHPRRRDALHAGDTDTLAVWCRALCRHLRPGGTATLVVSARLLALAKDALMKAGTGAVCVRPLLPRPDKAPGIVLVHAVAGASGATRTLPGLVLHAGPNGFTAEAEAVLRHGRGLGWES